MKSILYKLANNGKTQQWTIELSGNMYRTSEGYIGGAITTTAWTICEGKSIGKKNETSPEDQAAKEVDAIIAKKQKKDWARDINNIADSKRKVLPMLAKKFEDEWDMLYTSTTLIAAQPKLDGIRSEGARDAMYTKEGGIHTVTSAHIHQAVLEMLEGVKWEGLQFVDGELYNHKFRADFNKISSIVRKENPDAEELANAIKYLQYHVYDINLPGTFGERHANLVALAKIVDNPFIHLVETVFISTLGRSRADIEKQLFELHERWVREGYEGSMVRNANAKYEMKRVRSLLKRKDWIDDEFVLIDVLPGKGNKATMAASVTCKDDRGEYFDAGLLGDNKYCTDLLINKDKYIGKQVTIKYQNLTPDRKVPRFGKMKTVRDYE
jgi:DNA ligase 1